MARRPPHSNCKPSMQSYLCACAQHAAAAVGQAKSAPHRREGCWCCLQGALIEGYSNKVPKVVVGALDATLLLVRYATQLLSVRGWAHVRPDPTISDDIIPHQTTHTMQRSSNHGRFQRVSGSCARWLGRHM